MIEIICSFLFVRTKKMKHDINTKYVNYYGFKLSIVNNSILLELIAKVIVFINQSCYKYKAFVFTIY